MTITPHSVNVTSPPTALGQSLFDLPHQRDGVPSKRLPQEIKDLIFNQLDRSTLLRMRCINKPANAAMLDVRRKEFNAMPRGRGPDVPLQHMLTRQAEAKEAARIGQVTRVKIVVDCDPLLLGTTCYDDVANEELLWTRSGQLLAVGPYDAWPVTELLAAGSLTPYPRKTSAEQNPPIWSSGRLLGVRPYGSRGARRVLTYHPAQGLMLWTCGTRSAPQGTRLLFTPPLAEAGVDNFHKSTVTLSADATSVLYESQERTSVWRWHLRDNAPAQLDADFRAYPDKCHQTRAQDGLVLTADGQDLLLTDGETGQTATCRSHGNVARLLPFSPCGTLAAVVTSESAYEGQGRQGSRFWLSLYDVKKNNGATWSLSLLNDAPTDNYFGEHGVWSLGRNGQWHLSVDNNNLFRPVVPEYRDYRPRSATDKWLEAYNRQAHRRLEFQLSISPLGSDAKGATYSLAEFPYSVLPERSLVRRAADGVSSKIIVHKWVAEHLKGGGSSYRCALFRRNAGRSLWSRDGTMSLNGTQQRGDGKITYTLTKLRQGVPAETKRERFVRAAKATAAEAAAAARSWSSLATFLLPNLLPPLAALLGATLGCACVTAIGVGVARFLLPPILFALALGAAAVACRLEGHYTDPQPWPDEEVVSV